jgi:hypothetical protein
MSRLSGKSSGEREGFDNIEHLRSHLKKHTKSKYEFEDDS